MAQIQLQCYYLHYYFHGFNLTLLLASYIGTIKAPKLAVTLSCGLLAIASLWFIIYPIFSQNFIGGIAYIFGVICVAILLHFIKIMPKRTAYGNEALEKITGFKKFIENAKKEELERYINENPEYFYNIYPYICALGISKTCLKKIKDVKLSSINWCYINNDNPTIGEFDKILKNTIILAQGVATSVTTYTSYGGGLDSIGSDSESGGSSWQFLLIFRLFFINNNNKS